MRTLSVATIILGTSIVAATPTYQKYELRFDGVKSDQSASTVVCDQASGSLMGTCRMDANSLICSVELMDKGAWSCIVTLPSKTQLPARYSTNKCLNVYGTQAFNVTNGAVQLSSKQFRIDSNDCAYVIDTAARE